MSTTRMRMLFGLTVLVALASTAFDSATAQSNCGPRIRREWRQLSYIDKQLYRDAINASMASGYHTLFHEIVTDKASCNEAYLTSGSVFWHRRLLLAYENMLRSLDPRFECITIPYWDMFSDFASQTTGLCTTLESCSQFLSEFGGSNGSHTYVDINGVNSSKVNIAGGNCVNGLSSHGINTNETNLNFADFRNFCENSTLNANSSCAGCVPRGAWTATAMPAGLTYSALALLIRPSFGFNYFASTLQTGMQASIHNALGAAMSTCATAADPMFYSLHATFDLVHQMYYDCQIGRNLTETEKKASTSRYAYQRFTLATGVSSPSILANMTMYWNSTSAGLRMLPEVHPQLQQFFAPLPPQYWNYVSGGDLGANSYSYASDTLLSLLQLAGVTSCPQSYTRRLQEDLGIVRPAGGRSSSAGSSTSVPTSNAPTTVPTASTSTTAPTTSTSNVPTTGSTPSGSTTPSTTTSTTTSSSSSSASSASIPNTTTISSDLVLATTSASTTPVKLAVVQTFNCFQNMLDTAIQVADSEFDALESAAYAECVIYSNMFDLDEFEPDFLEGMGYPLNMHTPCINRFNQNANLVEDQSAVTDACQTHLSMTSGQVEALPETTNAITINIAALPEETTTEAVATAAIDTVTAVAAITGDPIA